MGATWLDRQLVTRETSLADNGFGASVQGALRAREQFLVDKGFAQRDRDSVKLPRNRPQANPNDSYRARLQIPSPTHC